MKYTGGIDGGRGWKGDVKEMLLDITKIMNEGWKPAYGSYTSIESTMRALHQTVA